MRRIGLSVVALMAASALAACSSSSSGGAAAQPTTGTSSTATTSSFDPVAAQHTAQAAVLTLHDLPAGFTSSPSTDSAADDATVNNQLASCLGVPASLFARSGPDKVEVNSDDFDTPNQGASGSVSETVDVETADRLSQEFAVVNSDKVPGCLQTVYGKFLKQKFAQDPQTKAAKIGTVTATKSNIPSYGDESAGFELKVPFSIGGTNAAVYLDIIFVRVGTVSAQVVFENSMQPFDTTTAATITQTATDKLSAAG